MRYVDPMYAIIDFIFYYRYVKFEFEIFFVQLKFEMLYRFVAIAIIIRNKPILLS